MNFSELIVKIISCVIVSSMIFAGTVLTRKYIFNNDNLVKAVQKLENKEIKVQVFSTPDINTTTCLILNTIVIVAFFILVLYLNCCRSK